MKILHVGNNCQLKRLWDVIIFWPQKSQIADIADNIPISFVPMSDLSQEDMLFEVKEIRELWEVRKWYTYFWDNDVLLAKVTPCFENGKCGIAKNLENGIWFWSSEFFVLRTKEEILPEYLYYIVSGKSFRGEWAKNMWWAVGLQRVKKEWLLNFQIPLPPLEEQKKIVAYLDELNATISKLKSEYQSQLAMLDEMRNSSLDLAFWGSRERAYNLNNWKWGKLGDVCEKIQYWFTGKIIEGGRYKYLRITDIQNSEVDWTSVPFVSINEIEAKKYLLKSWEIVFARTGATVGKSFLIWEIWEDKVFASYLIRIIPQYVRIKSEFLKYFFQSKIYWKQIFADATGAAQPNFNAKKLSFLKIPLPDLETQSQIVSHLDQVHQQITMLKTQLNSQIEHCDELWQSSLEKVLTQGVE